MEFDRIVGVVLIWVGLSLNPHPFKTKKGAAPNCLSGIGLLG
jgi:hypothetical protein